VDSEGLGGSSMLVGEGEGVHDQRILLIPEPTQLFLIPNPPPPMSPERSLEIHDVT